MSNDTYTRHKWTLLTSFFDDSFYEYTYTCAQIGAVIIHSQWLDAKKAGPAARADFVSKYTEFLESGLTRNFHEVMALFGEDTKNKAFWRKGTSIIKSELKKLFAVEKTLSKGKVPKL